MCKLPRRQLGDVTRQRYQIYIFFLPHVKVVKLVRARVYFFSQNVYGLIHCKIYSASLVYTHLLECPLKCCKDVNLLVNMLFYEYNPIQNNPEKNPSSSSQAITN